MMYASQHRASHETKWNIHNNVNFFAMFLERSVMSILKSLCVFEDQN